MQNRRGLIFVSEQMQSTVTSCLHGLFPSVKQTDFYDVPGAITRSHIQIPTTNTTKLAAACTSEVGGKRNVAN